MKTELDFTKVPLDKWVDLHNMVGDSFTSTTVPKKVENAWRDVKKAAEVQVKEEADLNKEIAEACDAYNVSMSSKDWNRMYEALNARRALLGIKPISESVLEASIPKPVEQKPELLPVEEVIK